VRFSGRVSEGVKREVLTAFNAVPKRGAETGGLLLGRLSPDELYVRDFEPVICSHRFGPRPERELDEQDRAWMDRCGGIFLLLEPSRDQSIRAYVYTRGGPGARLMVGETPFPVEEVLRLREEAEERTAGIWLPRREPAAAKEIPERSVPDVAPSSSDESKMPVTETATPRPPARVELPPPTRSPSLLPPEREPRRWLTPALVLLAMTAAGAFTGYRSIHTPPPPTPVELTRVPEPAPEPVPQAPPPASEPEAPAADQPVSADRVEPEPPAPAVRRTLDGWVRALRSGNTRLAASYYAPRVARYENRIDLTTADVRRAISDQISRRGVPAILRIDDLRVESADNTAAVVLFRRHWQTRGPRATGGEEEVRMRLVRAGKQWKIALEEVPKVYWTHGGS
jgi:hypothetical protein